MVIAIDPKGFESYICKNERGLDAAQQTTFELRHLTARDSSRIKDLFVAPQSNSGGSTSIEIDLLRVCLIGWRNFQDAEGAEVPFAEEPQTVFGQRRSVVRDDLLDMIPAPVRSELMQHLLERELHGLTEDDRGKH